MDNSGNDAGFTSSAGLLLTGQRGHCDYPPCTRDAMWLLHGEARCDEHRWIAQDGHDIREPRDA